MRANWITLAYIFEYSKGPMRELYAAEEAIGLVKALSWGVSIKYLIDFVSLHFNNVFKRYLRE